MAIFIPITAFRRLSLLLIVTGLVVAPIHGSAEGNNPNAGMLDVAKLHGCRIMADATIRCWGWNAFGQASPPAGTFTFVSAGQAHSCGVRTDGSLACWGYDAYGQASPPAGAFVAVSAGAIHDCGVRSDATLACWGYNVDGRASPPAGQFTSVSAGTNHSCGVRSDGTLACWGNNNWGQTSPPAGTFISVSAGEQYNCGVRSDGTLACWGLNGIGQASPPLGAFIAVGANSNHSCGVRTEGTLACWGQDYRGSLSAPTGAFIAVGVGESYGCGVRSDGTLACWGDDTYGQAPQLQLRPLTLLGATASTPYSQSFYLVDTAATATEEFRYTPHSPGFAVTSGALPPGLTLTAPGLLSGTPTNGGSFYFAVEGEDANGFTAQRSYSLFVEGPTDTSPPMIVPTVSGTLGANGWYTGDVTINWSVTDAESAVTSMVGCNTATLSSDAMGAGYTCTATSAGGTSTGSVTVKRDATAPVLAPEITPIVILLNGSGSTAANASDALSGVVTQGCSALDTTTVGNHASTCTAIDAAGNTATGTVSYSVIYGFLGFAPPVENAPVVNLANAGRTIPFKWRLVDANGTPITNLSGVTLRAVSMSCDSTAVADTVEEYVSAGTGFLNHGNGDYQYNWQSPKSYENTCKRVVIDLSDGSTRVALFRFH